MDEILDAPNLTTKYKLKLWIPLSWLGIFLIGYLFYATHWPFSALLRVLGFSGYAAYSFNAAFHLKGNNVINNVFIGLSALWIAVIVWGAFFNSGYPFNVEGVLANAVFLFVLFVVYAVINLIVYRKRG